MLSTLTADEPLVRDVQVAFSSPLLDKVAFANALGGSIDDSAFISKYLNLLPQDRPELSIYFDRIWYCLENPDVAESQKDPLYHFLAYGLKEMRSPHPLVDLHHIDANDPKHFAGAPTADALLRILEFGLTDPSPYFSVGRYNAQRSNQHDSPLRHFLTRGLNDGLRPHPLLDVVWYAGHYSDVPGALYEALRHFVMVGDREGRSSSESFNGTRYFQRYLDVSDAKVPALKHFLIYGELEGRQAVLEHFVDRSHSSGSIAAGFYQHFKIQSQ